MSIRNIQIDFDKICKHDQAFIHEMLADYIVEHELPEGDDFAYSYSIDVALEIFDGS